MFTTAAEERDAAGGMTLRGTVVRAANLLVLALASLVFAWIERSWALGFGLLSSAAAFGFGCAVRFNRPWAPWGAPVFAVLLGLALGAIASLGAPVLLQVVVAPVGVFASLLVIYQAGWLHPSGNRDLGLASAAGGLAFLYLFQGAARAALGWGAFRVPYVHGSGPWAIAWTLLALAGSAYNLVLDFDTIEQGVRRGAPKHMEWYGAFGLLVAVVWFYVEGLLAVVGYRRAAS